MGSKYTEYGTTTINGKKRIIYCKDGSTKKYLKYKDRMMNLVKYKKMIAKKNIAKKLASKKVVIKATKPVKSVKPSKKGKKPKHRGGFFANSEASKKEQSSQQTQQTQQNQAAGNQTNVMSAFKNVALGVSNNLKAML